MNTLHNWFHVNYSQETICKHREVKSSTDIDMMQIDEPPTAAEKHSDEAQKDYGICAAHRADANR